jgi:hypothetical protein
MVVVAQLVRAMDCGSIGRGFEPRLPPKKTFGLKVGGFLINIRAGGFFLYFYRFVSKI